MDRNLLNPTLGAWGRARDLNLKNLLINVLRIRLPTTIQADADRDGFLRAEMSDSDCVSRPTSHRPIRKPFPERLRTVAQNAVISGMSLPIETLAVLLRALRAFA